MGLNAARAQLADAPGDILKLLEHPDYPAAVPTPDHFIPLLYLAGLAAADGTTPEMLIEGYTMGSLSMTSYGLCTGLKGRAVTGVAATVSPDIPPDQTNI